MLDILFRFRGAIFNLLLIIYLVFVGPAVLERLSAPAREPGWLFAGLLIGIQGIELVGLLLKRPLNAYYASRSSVPAVKFFSFYALPAMFHLFLTVFLIFASAEWVVCQQDRFGIGSRCLPGGVYLLLGSLVIVKEAFFVALMAPPIPYSGRLSISRLDAWAWNRLLPKVPDAIAPGLIARDLLGDLCLLVFSTLAYSAVWDFLFVNLLGPRAGWGLAGYFIASVLFCFIWFGVQAAHLSRELYFTQGRLEKIMTWVGFVFVWLTVLLTLPRG